MADDIRVPSTLAVLPPNRRTGAPPTGHIVSTLRAAVKRDTVPRNIEPPRQPAVGWVLHMRLGPAQGLGVHVTSLG